MDGHVRLPERLLGHTTQRQGLPAGRVVAEVRLEQGVGLGGVLLLVGPGQQQPRQVDPPAVIALHRQLSHPLDQPPHPVTVLPHRRAPQGRPLHVRVLRVRVGQGEPAFGRLGPAQPVQQLHPRDPPVQRALAGGELVEQGDGLGDLAGLGQLRRTGQRDVGRLAVLLGDQVVDLLVEPELVLAAEGGEAEQHRRRQDRFGLEEALGRGLGLGGVADLRQQLDAQQQRPRLAGVGGLDLIDEQVELLDPLGVEVLAVHAQGDEAEHLGLHVIGPTQGGGDGVGRRVLLVAAPHRDAGHPRARGDAQGWRSSAAA